MGPAAECADCGLTFPLRQGDGLCPKCAKLEPHSNSSAEYKNFAAWPQCAMCGITRKNMPVAEDGALQTCASSECMKLARFSEDNDGEEDSEPLRPTTNRQPAPETHQNRAIALQKRLRLTVPNKAGGGTHHTTSSLKKHEHGGGAPGEDKIIIAWHVKVSGGRSKNSDSDYGRGAHKYAMSMYLPDIKSEVLQQVNTEWNRKGRSDLNPDEVHFRWADGKTLDPGTATMNLTKFHRHYNKEADLFLDKVPPAWKPLQKSSKNPFIAFELYVDQGAWELRTSSPDIENDETMSSFTSNMPSMASKRKRTSSTSASSPNKRRVSQPSGTALRSEFRPSGLLSIATVHTRSAVTLKRLDIVTDSVEGVPELEDRGEKITGFLRDEPFAQGSMKAAYDLLEDNTQQHFVAKRFFRLSGSEAAVKGPVPVVPLVDNNAHLRAEACRLGIAQWLLNAFFKDCHARGVDVDRNIIVASAYLGQELGTPSKASGLDKSAETGEGAMWLVEMKRPSTVYRWSGTLSHVTTKRRDHTSQTIYAFAHFAFKHTHRKLVLADIQGSPTPVNGCDGIVLFDFMTHTAAGDSGVGDFGNDGIATFTKDHMCGTICQSLELHLDAPLNDEEDNDAPGEGGGD